MLEQKRIIDGLTDRLEELAPKLKNSGANDYEQNPTRQAIIVPYFSYSILAPSTFEEDETVLVKGHFVIENKGTAPLSTPIICLAFNKPELANLTGKINRPRAPKDHVAQMNESDGWSFRRKRRCPSKRNGPVLAEAKSSGNSCLINGYVF